MMSSTHIYKNVHTRTKCFHCGFTYYGDQTAENMQSVCLVFQDVKLVYSSNNLFIKLYDIPCIFQKTNNICFHFPHLENTTEKFHSIPEIASGSPS